MSDRDIVDRLAEVGGFDPVAELCSEARSEIIRLREKCNNQAMILRRLTPENYPGVYFITGEIGLKDTNGLPEKLLVVPAYGADWHMIYERTDKAFGPEW